MKIPKDEQIQALLSQRAFKIPTLRCANGYKIERFCSNEACKYDSLCCEEQQCQCESLHQPCSFKKLRQLNKSVEERLSFDVKVLRGLFAIQTELMNKLMGNRKQIKKCSAGWKHGMHNQLIDSIYFKNIITGIKGKQMKDLYSELSEKSNIEKKADQYLSTYKAEGQLMVEKLEKMKKDLIFDLMNCKQSLKKDEKQKQAKEENNLQMVSRILAEDKQGKQKYSYLLKELNYPSSLKLLFRASQHNFSASKFHQYCDGISDTVTIVRTSFGKTIAGFTPLKWKTVEEDQFVCDESGRSFLLQLQLKERMNLTQPEKAIRMYPNYGPLFGRGSDLGISDQCNQNSESGCTFSTSYNCEGKYQQNQRSWTAFCGSPTNKFRVVEYEVFAVSK